MARKKARAEDEHEDIWALYQSLQLTPEQKAEARKVMEAKCAEAARNGVYDKVLALVGKVKFDLDIDELREDRD